MNCVAPDIRLVRLGLTKPFGALMGLLILANLPLSAATIWSDSEAEVDEHVADTQTLAPVDLVKPAFAQIPFVNFRYPHVTGDMDVTFIADDPVFPGEGKHHGIYRSIGKTGELVPLVRQGDPLPGLGARIDWIRGLQVDGADFVFNATDRSGDEQAHAIGLYHYHNGTVTLIARSRLTIVPGMEGPLTDVRWAALSQSRVLYMAMAGTTEALVLHDLKTKQDRLLIKSGMPIPGRASQVFGHIGHQDWMESKNIVFRAAAQIPNRKNKSRDDDLLFGWFGIDWSHLDQSLSLSRLTPVVNDKTSVPLMPADDHFEDIRSAPVRDGLIGFMAISGSTQGIYFTSIGDKTGAIKPVVDTESQMQGLFDGAFQSFSIWSTVFKDSVVFVGYGPKGFAGVFLYRTDKDELFLLTDNRVPLEGKKIKAFEIAGDFLVDNRFAVTALFTDRTSGVYLATIPTHSFKRISASPPSVAPAK